jgi:anti-sigma regulatory factor (Ser/Thr protein kinase)
MKELRILPGPPPPLETCVFSGRWPSRIDFKQEIMDTISEQLLSRHWIAEAEKHWIFLCLDEVLVNAMLHGNEGDPRLEVSVSVATDGRRWIVVVADQGDGFTQALVPDPDKPQSLMLEHGRGIRIMQEWLDELMYYRNGSCAWLARRRDDVTDP